MKAAMFMLAGCALLGGCATRVPQAPQRIMSPAEAVPSPTSRSAEASAVQTNEVDLTRHYIRISGGVARPGFYPVGSNTSTLLRAFDTAGASGWRVPSVLEIHRVDGSVEIHRLRDIETGRTKDPIIHANDHIHVPKRSAGSW